MKQTRIQRQPAKRETAPAGAPTVRKDIIQKWFPEESE